jgi:endo-1,4-beta-xylanase
MSMARRRFIQLTSVGAGALWLGRSLQGHRLPLLDPSSLKARAAAKGLFYGAAVRTGLFQKDPAFAQAYFDDCGLVVPATAFKWDNLRPRPGPFDFRAPDDICSIAAAHGMRVRGHTLVWYRALPDWFATQVTASNAEAELHNHINTVMRRYRGRIQSWDVVNEAIDPSASRGLRSDGLSKSPWLDLLGSDYVATAFRMAHEADPDVLLVYNDNHMEYDSRYFDRKRDLVLQLLQKLKSQGAPVGALGIQAHLDAAETRFNDRKYRDFLGSVAALGLKIIISELDVSDEKVPGTVSVRDQAVASAYSSYLSAALDELAVIGVVTWGLSDRDTWLARDHKRDDGDPLRPLPLDSDLRKKPAYEAIGRALDAAPARS